MEIRPKKLDRIIIRANILLRAGSHREALVVYTEVLGERPHPVAYLNRALCFILLGQHHLAVNDSLRARIMAEAILEAIGSPHPYECKEARLIADDIRSYAPECTQAFYRGETWCETVIPNFTLSRMTLSEELPNSFPGALKRHISATQDLFNKAFYRLVTALVKCGPGPAHAALQIIEDAFRLDADASGKQQALDLRNPAFSSAENSSNTRQFIRYGHRFTPDVSRQIKAVSDTIFDEVLSNLDPAKPTLPVDHLSRSHFCIFKGANYDFVEVEDQIDCDRINEAMTLVDNDCRVKFIATSDMRPTLVAAQTSTKDTVLFSEALPFVVSTKCNPEQTVLSNLCEACGAGLNISPPFVLRILAEESNHHDPQESVSESTDWSYSQGHSSMEEGPGDTPQSTKQPQSIPPTPKLADDLEEGEIVSPSIESRRSFVGRRKHSSISDLSETNTPPRGKQPPDKTGSLEFSDLQVCRSGNENLSFCCYECYDLAISIYHDSMCASNIENYLRQSIPSIEQPMLPSAAKQQLTLLLVLRILGWAFGTSTDPLDLPIFQLFLASPRHSKLKETDSVAWSFLNNVFRPIQMYQAMDGRTAAPRTASKPNFTDGRVLNTIIGLVGRHLYQTRKPHYVKVYDSEGFLEETLPCESEMMDDQTDEPIFFGYLHPLCDLVPLASETEQANVEFIDLGDGRVICVPLVTDDADGCIPKDTPLLSLNARPRLATPIERGKFARKEDYGEGGTMSDANKDHEETGPDEGEEGNPEGESGHEEERKSDELRQSNDQEEEGDSSGYLDEETYGATLSGDEDMLNFEEDEIDF